MKKHTIIVIVLFVSVTLTLLTRGFVSSELPVELPAELSTEQATNTDAENQSSLETLATDTDAASSYLLSAEVTSVPMFYLWIYDDPTGSTMVCGYSPWTAENGDLFSEAGISDVLTLTEEDETYYLIPVRYLEAISDFLSGYSFVSSVCPFLYAPDAANGKANLTEASYVSVDDTWYVKVQNTGSYSNPDDPRCNLYYNPGNSFSLIGENSSVTFELQDEAGNPVYATLPDLVLEDETRYIFGDAAEESNSETSSVLANIVPEIPGYASFTAALSGTTVTSVATAGYTNTIGGTVAALRFYGTEPVTTGNYYTRANGTYTITITYTKEMTPIANVVSTNSTTVNLFDYWLTEWDASDYHANNDTGINLGHTLKFHYSSSDAIGTLNRWTGTAGGVLQGIVGNLLVSGFPALSGNTAVGLTAVDTESLAYLFDPGVTNDYKASFRDVSGLFQTDELGYLYYDSRQNFAEFHESTNSFVLYEESGVAEYDTNGEGMFFPFNTIEETYPISSSENTVLNHYFGLTLTTRFSQQHEGYTDASHTRETTFSFSGDDDVWIFIDDVLVADLGGIHDAASVTINFVTGSVTIDNVYDGNSGKYPVTTYFSDIFEGSDVALSQNEAGTTLQDNTDHTLKFFYLERGNVDSNLKLSYNLTDIPDTSIYKVDQYGAAVPGATFAIYAYDSVEDGSVPMEYGYPTASGKTISFDGLLESKNAELISDSYDINQEDGTITVNVSGTKEIILPLYVGVTDEQGEMTFLDEDGVSYSIDKLKSMFGEYFILREIKVPDGYRTVSDDILLYFEDELLQCFDPYSTGVWASPNALVTASNTLVPLGGEDPISFYDPVTGNNTGMLFAVVLKNTDENPDLWEPIYGTDETGYKTVPVEDGQLSAVLAAARMQEEVSSLPVFAATVSGMQMLITDLPGEATTYYTYLLDHDDPSTPEYVIAYYYTTADSTSDMALENTVQISSHGGTDYAAFSVQWGATIEVPNIINSLYVQKADVSGNLLNDATFALYEAVVEERTGYYVGKDENGNEAYIRLIEDGTAAIFIDLAELDPVYGSVALSEDGTITVTTDAASYTISPANNALGEALVCKTHDACDIIRETGTGHFWYLSTGTYFLKEIAAPAGYDVNPVNIPVEVTKEGVYANAGTVENQVRVGNGAGYLVKTMGVFASLGEIDETLSFISTKLKIAKTEGEFLSDLDNTFYVHGHLTNDYLFSGFGVSDTEGTSYIPAKALTTGDTLGTDSAMVGYLRYEGDLTENIDQNKVFDYALYREDGVPSYRLWTESGWSDLAIYQDYDYGSVISFGSTHYTDLRDYGEISYLFSSSTFVQVTDEDLLGTLEITKKVIAEEEEMDDSYDFRLTGMPEGTAYEIQDADGLLQESGQASESFSFSLKADETIRFFSLPYGTAYTLTELVKKPGGTGYYVTTIAATDFPETITNQISGTLLWKTSDATNQIVVTNTLSHVTTAYSLPMTGISGLTWILLYALITECFFAIRFVYLSVRKEKQQ